MFCNLYKSIIIYNTTVFFFVWWIGYNCVKRIWSILFFNFLYIEASYQNQTKKYRLLSVKECIFAIYNIKIESYAQSTTCLGIMCHSTLLLPVGEEASRNIGLYPDRERTVHPWRTTLLLCRCQLLVWGYPCLGRRRR